MSQTVAEALVDVLEQIGVKQVFGLIGDSLNPLGDAIRRSSTEWIGVRHEEGAALAASGQAKLTGRLAVCAGTTGPGSNHLVAGLYEASRDHAPVLALSGEMPRKMKGTDFFQATEPDLLFRDVSLYTQTISSSEQAPLVIHQAIAAAYAGPGVAHLTLPQDVLSAKAAGTTPSLATLQPRAEISPDESRIAEVVERIDPAQSVVILCGAGCREAAELLRALSDRLKAPLRTRCRTCRISNWIRSETTRLRRSRKPFMRSPAAKLPIATVTFVMVGPGAAVRGPTIDP
jgi:pyruvate dehydrogenase (quinone)